jgi:hypothetical protein
LEDVVVAFRGMAAGRAAGIETLRLLVKGCAGWEEPITQFEGENAILVTGLEGFGEGLPVHGFDHGVGPVEAGIHVGFQHAEAVLTPDSWAEFARDSFAAYGELDFGGREERGVLAREGVFAEFVSGQYVGVAI